MTFYQQLVKPRTLIETANILIRKNLSKRFNYCFLLHLALDFQTINVTFSLVNFDEEIVDNALEHDEIMCRYLAQKYFWTCLLVLCTVILGYNVTVLQLEIEGNSIREN